ncbi:MAG TPA: DUF2231 domain-containing protein [Anaerolineaceae bacterium]|nr:DUF2231 domain-containing protein [Anaerolineaceae bacterium]
MDIINRIIHALTELHPIHAMFVHFPIALTGSAFLFVLLAWWRNNKTLELTAYYNMILAAISTFFAGATGVYDNNLNYDGEAPFAPVKIILGLTLSVLSVALVLTRRKKPDLFEKSRFMYVLVYGICFGIALVLGFLGGAILYGF